MCDYRNHKVQGIESYSRMKRGFKLGDMRKSHYQGIQNLYFSGCEKEVFTFSFCCDLTVASFSCSVFNLASSSSCCLAAMAASSLATSSCWARHCCSYRRACKYTPRGETEKRLLSISSFFERNTHRETTGCQSMAKGVFV